MLGRTVTTAIAVLAGTLLIPTPLASGTPAAAAAPPCGASFLPETKGETYQQAFERVNDYYGLESVRVFYSGLPRHWPGKVDAGKLPLSVSFKANPREVTAGKHDQHFRKWFAETPKDVDVHWTYYHEPEDNIEKGQFTAAEFRAAWKHLHGIAQQANNPRLRSSLILMSWTADPPSERNWKDYYPGSAYVDVLTWDAYNKIKGTTKNYRSPEEILGNAVAVNKAAGKPLAIGELGSALASGDKDGSGRAAWLRETTEYLAQHGALWVQYFDVDYRPQGHSDYRLRDKASKTAWHDFCRR
ncbi:Glycosyl hydrolase family 26 [Amycolatopsis marina]|uniref:Glycosyl hydrolase family 26 n=1 Tax=Amycolatopsis marina TaxID=490629 RepID=A0A1I0WS73_9PSEU|nr:glycosyl hydrolase [Amycolatopsis marina]SFA91595.1 Glycosyl hydrolase family 26 [Amycolatopsis marina]